MTTAKKLTSPYNEQGHKQDQAALLDNLAAGVNGAVESVIVGLNWTLVHGPLGVGLAQTPARGAAGCFSLPNPGRYGEMDLGALAALRNSDNIFEQTVAQAAINAYHNRFDCEGEDINGLDLLENLGAKTAIVGRFPSLETRLPGAIVIEREPGPNDYPEEAADELLPNCEQVAITASTLINGSLPKLLALTKNAFTVLVGPSAPLASCLFDQGVDAISGFVATDVPGLTRIVCQGGAVRAMKPFGRNITIRKPA
ncbi:MAG: Rossmann-like domain-containing protein [Alphaproteobacteria bacterium]